MVTIASTEGEAFHSSSSSCKLHHSTEKLTSSTAFSPRWNPASKTTTLPKTIEAARCYRLQISGPTITDHDDHLDVVIDCTQPRRRWSSLPVLGEGAHHNTKWLKRESDHLHECFKSFQDLSTVVADDDDCDVIKSEMPQDNSEEQHDIWPNDTVLTNNQTDNPENSVTSISNDGTEEDEVDYFNHPRRYSDPGSFDHRFLRRQSQALRRDSQCLHQILMSVEDLNAILLEEDEEGDDSWDCHTNGHDIQSPKSVLTHHVTAIISKEEKDSHDHSVKEFRREEDWILDTSSPQTLDDEATKKACFYDAMVLRYHHAELNEICDFLDNAGDNDSTGEELEAQLSAMQLSLTPSELQGE